MKTIQGGNESAQWSNELIRDLAFIKKHLRYRFSKKILYGSAGVGLVFLFMLRLAVALWLIDRVNVWQNPVMWGVLIGIAILLFIPIYGYTQLIRFKVITTPFFSSENQRLIQQFLNSLHLVVFRHPEAPEVFQIMSKNLSTSDKKEQREIIVFIADDKRILINSHYSVGNFNLQPPSYNYRLMRKQLQKFVNGYSGYDNTNIVPINN